MSRASLIAPGLAVAMTLLLPGLASARGGGQAPRVLTLQPPIEREVHGNYMSVPGIEPRSEEHTSELQSLMRISYAVLCLKKKNRQAHHQRQQHQHLQDGRRQPRAHSKRIHAHPSAT